MILLLLTIVTLLGVSGVLCIAHAMAGKGKWPLRLGVGLLGACNLLALLLNLYVELPTT
ncbi:hypothetical protein HIIECEMK_00028 [Klebsiella phage vB_KqP-Goliath]|nr:hypothetical protein HIIECEMK_00028 [Klebsiella phage vB_KqP-Goliath]CAD5239558.1 hypothetical protein BLCJPOBP_00027 [Klebsiella phage vB_KpP-Yoda]